MTQCHLILLLSTVFASAALVSSLAGSSLEGTELSSSSVFGGCFAAVLLQWVPGHVRQHMIMVFCVFAGTPERRGRSPWLIDYVAGARMANLRWSKVSYPIKGGNLAIFFCCLQVVCVVSLAPWGAIE
jgi:hypothetical protein